MDIGPVVFLGGREEGLTRGLHRSCQRPMHHPPINQPINQSINQSTNQSITLPINQSINQTNICQTGGPVHAVDLVSGQHGHPVVILRFPGLRHLTKKLARRRHRPASIPFRHITSHHITSHHITVARPAPVDGKVLVLPLQILDDPLGKFPKFISAIVPL